jgi:hypothetical protein
MLCALHAVPALAGFAAVASVPTRVSTLEQLAPTPVDGATNDGCAHVLVTWTASAGANSYAIDRQRDGGTWLRLSSDAGSGTQFDDAPGATTGTLRYRVSALHRPSSWSGPAAATPTLTCP